APQPRRRGGTPDEAALEHLVELAVGADQERRAKEARAIAGRVAVARSVVLGVRTARREARRGRGSGRRARGDAVARAGRPASRTPFSDDQIESRSYVVITTTSRAGTPSASSGAEVSSNGM